MAKKLTIEEELLAVTELKKKKNEDQQKYFARLIEAANKLDEDVWEGVAPAAQKWVVEGTELFNDKKDVPNFPDAVDAEEEEAGDEEASETEEETDTETGEQEEEKPAKKAKKEKAAPKKKAAKKEEDAEEDEGEEPEEKPAKKAKETAKKKSSDDTEPKSRIPKQSGIKVRIKTLLLKDPKISVGDLYDKLSKDGDQVPSKMTVAGIRAEFRHSLQVLKDQKLIDIEL